jgi:hypothetical protein
MYSPLGHLHPRAFLPPPLPPDHLPSMSYANIAQPETDGISTASAATRSLICNNCTYSCNHCGNKIEDLAILTGDQAFCANCFRCRNCKRKIENLRYARTSQGIFCMSCHESLMARRRKKSKKPPSVAPKVDKSLPALPPQEQATSTFTPDLDTPSDVFSEPTTTDVSPRPPQPRRGDSSSNFRRDASPIGDISRRGT